MRKTTPVKKCYGNLLTSYIRIVELTSQLSRRKIEPFFFTPVFGGVCRDK